MVFHYIEKHISIRTVEEDVKVMIDSKDGKKGIQEAIHILAS
jgi:hypothetical protein